jgi:hypothetical protein
VVSAPAAKKDSPEAASDFTNVKPKLFLGFCDSRISSPLGIYQKHTEYWEVLKGS